MKNLHAILRLSPFAAFVIFIVLGVCFAGAFGTDDEIVTNGERTDFKQKFNANHQSKDSVQTNSVSFFRENSNGKSDEFLEPKNFAENFMKFAEAESEENQKIAKRNSDDFNRDADADDAKKDPEADGYGYDDDEYYHLEFKRNDDTATKADGKEAVQENANKKEGFLNQKFNFGQKPLGQSDKDKDSQTVEMLSFKESHPVLGSEDSVSKSNVAKPMMSGATHKKLPSQPVSSLNMKDLKENSAIEEKMKDRKDESSGLGASAVAGDQKADGKKSVKVSEEKDSLKLKDSKYGEETEKKDKEVNVNVKENKESVVGSSIKDGKEKLESELKSGAKVAENMKLEDNIEKISSKSKDRYTSKISGGDQDGVKLNSKLNADEINSNDITQSNNRASFVSNDLKNNGNSVKTQAIDEDEKDSEEFNEKNVGLNDYEDEVREKESLRDGNAMANYEYRNDEGYNSVESQQEGDKKSDYMTIPITFEIKQENLNDFYKRPNSWKECATGSDTQQQVNQQPATYDRSNEESLRLALPQSELENTDFHKNYLKSLKKYKAMDSHPKILAPDRINNNNNLKAANVDEFHSETAKRKNAKKRKRSKVSKRKSVSSYAITDSTQPVDASDLKNVYNQLDAMQFLQQQQQKIQEQLQQQQRQQSQPLPMLPTYHTNAPEGSSYSSKTNYDRSKENSRETRKSPTKLEYEIKIINQNQQDVVKDAPLLKTSSQKRKRKNVETNPINQPDEKLAKKYPYYQVPKDDLTRFGDYKSGFIERKFKRAPAWEDQLDMSRQVDESLTKTKGAPSGYYGNRVKFGQKHYAPKDMGQSGRAYFNSNNQGSPFSNQKFSSDLEGNYLQRAWRDPKIYQTKHDAIKRYDENAIFGKNHQNSLLLVKKDRSGERITKTFVDANSKAEPDANLNSDQLAKILSKDNDYIVLKKTEKNKFQKVEDGQGKPINEGSSLSKKSDMTDLGSLDAGKEISKGTRGLFGRSYRSNDQKLHNQSTKSSLKKTFEKFKDFADFFKDSDQDSTDNQQTTQEVKDGSEIVFSDDKIPDPIVISSDLDGTTGTNMKTQANSMPSISNNFKTLDQEKKTNDFLKFEDPKKDFLVTKELSEKSSWEPALKNVFPEAKSINSIQKNGNEIIVLDFDRNHIKTDQGNKVVLLKPLKETLPFDTRNEQVYLPFGSVQKTPNNLLNVAGNRQIEVVLNEDSLPTFLESNVGMNKNSDKNTIKQSKLSDNEQAGMVMTIPNGQQPVITFPLGQLSQIPYLLKQSSEKKLVDTGGYKATSKKSLNVPTSNALPLSGNYDRFLRDYRELSKINGETWQPLKKVKLNKKRNSIDFGGLPPSSFPELSTYGGANVKLLNNILQNMANNENDYDATGTKLGIAKSSESRPGWQQNAAEADTNLPGSPQAKWTPSSSSQKLLNSHRGNSYQFKENFGDFSNSEETQDGAGENEYQNELLQALSAASKKIQRLRREGIAEGELKKIIKNTLPPRKKRSPNEVPRNMAADIKRKRKTRQSDRTNHFQNEAIDEGSGQRSIRNLISEEAVGSGREHHNANSATKEPAKLIGSKESAERNWSHRRRKRSPPSNDFEAKVSNSEVQSKILKKLEEDTDQSVYSPGIKPMKSLQSRGGSEEEAKDLKETDDTNGSYLTYTERLEEIADKSHDPIDCVKNTNDKCIEPSILKLFREDEEHARKKRNTFASTHANYKREIDLDESVPNYFQNFLVTSLGLDSHVTPHGNQKLGTDKWENNKVSDGGTPSGTEDSPLEKRDVSNVEDAKRGQSYGENSDYFKNGNPAEKLLPDAGKRANYPGLKSKLQEKPTGNAKATTAEFEESKAPTQIRIQITKASSKEKKSSKPGLEENEMASNDVETTPKEKKFYDKNKFAPLHAIDGQKFWPISKYKYPVDFGEGEASEEAGQQKYYVMARPFRKARRKKKKYIQENPMKPIKDFIAFDQKAMEGLVRKYFADQNIQRVQSNQKLPAANHLPQVETVYNPTQGTNKAQVDAYKPMLKVNSLSNKNSVSGKNSFQSNDASTYDEGLLRSYLKEKSARVKTDKPAAKEFEDVDWKSYARPRPNAKQVGQQEIQNFKPYPAATQLGLKSDANMKKATANQMKWYQVSNTNYMNDNPSPANIFGTNASPNPTKIKPGGQLWNPANKDNANAVKGWRKIPNYMNGSPYSKEPKDKNPIAVISPAEESWNLFDRYLTAKRPAGEKYKLRSSFGGLNDATKMRFNPYRYYRPFEEDKPAILEPLQQRILAKDADYPENLEDEYVDSEELKQEPQFVIEPGKKEGKFLIPAKYPNLFSYKNIDLDEMLNDDEEEADEDYEEYAEDSGDEYSFLSPPNLLSSEITKKLIGENDKLRGSYYADDGVYPRTRPADLQLHGTTFEQTELRNPKAYERFGPDTTQMALREVKSDVDPFGDSGILKKVNENANILGKNLMKNLNRYNYDGNVKETEKMMENRAAAMADYQNPEIRSSGEKLNKKKLDWQAKLKRSQGLSPVGSRLFYAAKTEMPESRDASQQNAHLSQRRNNRNIYYHLPKRNPRNVRLENESENESEKNDQFFTPNSVNGESRENDRKSDDSMDSGILEDVKSNMEDNSETISEDNVLENVIGKYLMRKSVGPEQNFKKDENEKKKRDETESPSGDSSLHQRKKKSLKDEIYSEKSSDSKVWNKRLSSGHLTENNFKKFHKKNLNRLSKSKLATDFDQENGEEEDEKEMDSSKENADSKPEAENENDEETGENQWKIKGKKRSALNLFKKLSGKDRDGKKESSADASMVGFEPILSTGESKFDLSSDDRADGLVRKGEPTPLVTANQEKRIFPSLTDKTKEKSKLESVKSDGPWKIDLNEKYDEKTGENRSKESGKSVLREGDSLGDKVALPLGATSSDVKTYLVLRNNVVRSPEKSRVSDATKVVSDASETSKKEAFLLFPVNSSAPKPLRNSDRKRPKRQSAFQLPTIDVRKEAGDRRLVDEATSEYLGQRIVDAILYEVSQNPRLKKTIEPGLAGKAINEKQNGFENLNRNEDCSEQMQSLLQKIMFDIEKIAERHVKKKMCNKIDKRSQEFLHSLLQVSVDEGEEDDDGEKLSDKMDAKFATSEYQCPKTCSPGTFHACDDSTGQTSQNSEPSSPPPPSPPSGASSSQASCPDEAEAKRLNCEMYERLKKKQNTLLKLIDDYQRLTELEKQTISVNFQYLQNELRQTNQLLSTLSDTCQPCQSGEKAEQEKTGVNYKPKTNMELREKGFEKGTKCDLQNVTADGVEDNCNAKKTELPPKYFYQFEPGKREGVEEPESPLGDPSTASPPPHPEQSDPKEQGFESVGDKPDKSQQSEDQGQTEEPPSSKEPSKNDSTLKGYSSPLFVHFKRTNEKEKTGKISKDDLSRMEKTSGLLKEDTNIRTGAPELRKDTKDAVERLTPFKKDGNAPLEDAYDDEYTVEQKSLTKRHRNDVKGSPKRKQRKECTEKPEENESDFEENPALEYLIWSSMPAVRRRLNNLELGEEFRGVPSENAKSKK